jgi:dedicator of cytokinesis protein 3
MIRLLEVVSEVVETETFVPAVNAMDSFDIKLWTSLFELICELAASDELVLEDQGQQRRRAQWIIAGDLRDQTAALLHRLWNAIGWSVDQAQPSSLRYGGVSLGVGALLTVQYQTRLTNLGGRILGLCLSGHDAMCETAVEILFSMIYAEYVLDGKFESIQTEIFAKLDTLVSPHDNTRHVL